MGLFDWFLGLFGSKSDDKNTDSEGNIERDVSKGAEEGIQDVYEKDEAPVSDQDQAIGALKAEGEHEAEVRKTEGQKIAEEDSIHGKDKLQDQVDDNQKAQDEHEAEVRKAEE